MTVIINGIKVDANILKDNLKHNRKLTFKGEFDDYNIYELYGEYYYEKDN